MLLFPTGAGESRQIDVGDLSANAATFVPAGLTVAVIGTRNGAPAAVVVDVQSGKRSTLAFRELQGWAFNRRRFLSIHASPDGALLAVQADNGKVLGWPLPNGGPAQELAAIGESEVFSGWSADPARIFVAAWSGPKARIDTVEVGTGRRTVLREITVADADGLLMVPHLHLSADARSYVYGSSRMLSTLYLVTGLR